MEVDACIRTAALMLTTKNTELFTPSNKGCDKHEAASASRRSHGYEKVLQQTQLYPSEILIFLTKEN